MVKVFWVGLIVMTVHWCVTVHSSISVGFCSAFFGPFSFLSERMLSSAQQMRIWSPALSQPYSGALPFIRSIFLLRRSSSKGHLWLCVISANLLARNSRLTLRSRGTLRRKAARVPHLNGLVAALFGGFALHSLYISAKALLVKRALMVVRDFSKPTGAELATNTTVERDASPQSGSRPSP